MTTEDTKKLRGSIKALRERVEQNTEQLARFNENIEDFLQVLEQLMPLAEGAAAGNQMLSMVLPVFKGLLAKRRGKRGGD